MGARYVISPLQIFSVSLLVIRRLSTGGNSMLTHTCMHDAWIASKRISIPMVSMPRRGVEGRDPESSSRQNKENEEIPKSACALGTTELCARWKCVGSGITCNELAIVVVSFSCLIPWDLVVFFVLAFCHLLVAILGPSLA